MWKKLPSFSKRKQVAATTDGPAVEPTELELTVLGTRPVPDVELKGRLKRPQEHPAQQHADQPAESGPQKAATPPDSSAGDTSAAHSDAEEPACVDHSSTHAHSDTADDAGSREEPSAPSTPLRDASAVPSWPTEESQLQQKDKVEQHTQQQAQQQQDTRQALLEGSCDARLAVSLLLAQLPGEPCLLEQLRQSSSYEAFLSQYCDAVVMCKLLLSYFRDALDERALVQPTAQPPSSHSLASQQRMENAQLCVSSAQGAGIRVQPGAAAATVAGDAAAISSLLLAVATGGEQAAAGADAAVALRQLRNQQLVPSVSGQLEGQEGGWQLELLVAWAREVVRQHTVGMQQQLQPGSAAGTEHATQAAQDANVEQLGAAQAMGVSSSGTSSSLYTAEWAALLMALVPESKAVLQPLVGAAPEEAQAAAVLQAIESAGAGLALVTPGDLAAWHGTTIHLLLLRLLRSTASTWRPQWLSNAAASPRHKAAKGPCSSEPSASTSQAPARPVVPGSRNGNGTSSHPLTDSNASNGAAAPAGNCSSTDGMTDGMTDTATAYEEFVDEDDDPSISREERVLRTWINTLGVTTHCNSLFGPEIRAGWLLLEVVDALSPGSVNLALANRPPFRKAVAELKSAENCALVVAAAQERLGLQLVSISGRDIVHGNRKAILSFVFQLCRYHTLQLLDSISLPHNNHSRQPSFDGAESLSVSAAESSTATAVGGNAADASSMPAPTDGATAAGTATPPVSASGTPRRLSADDGNVDDSTSWVSAASSTASSSHFNSSSTPVRSSQITPGQRTISFRSSSSKQRHQLRIRESDILDWCNAKLQQHHSMHQLQSRQQQQQRQRQHVQPSEPVTIRSFRDPCLARTALLRLLQAMRPDAVDDSHITPGDTPQQREANAKYALSVARRLGASIYLVWEDIVELQPRMLLVLLASLMWLDQGRRRSLCNG